MFVYTLLEESKNHGDYWSFSTVAEKPLIKILTEYQFHSKKSLIDFLKKNQEIILKEFPIDDDNLELLENQKFLDHLDQKWYSSEIINPHVSPQQILDLSIKYKIITEKDILGYLIEETDDYEYKLFKSILHK